MKICHQKREEIQKNISEKTCSQKLYGLDEDKKLTYKFLQRRKIDFHGIHAQKKTVEIKTIGAKSRDLQHLDSL
jgi:hypothetical protein